jgi:hypothetical protein
VEDHHSHVRSVAQLPRVFGGRRQRQRCRTGPQGHRQRRQARALTGRAVRFLYGAGRDEAATGARASRHRHAPRQEASPLRTRWHPGKRFARERVSKCILWELYQNGLHCSFFMPSAKFAQAACRPSGRDNSISTAADASVPHIAKSEQDVSSTRRLRVQWQLRRLQ